MDRQTHPKESEALILNALQDFPNQPLQRTRSAVTLAASNHRLSPAMQPARQLRESLSLGSFGQNGALDMPDLKEFLEERISAYLESAPEAIVSDT